jgi:hypothetical protein
MRKTKMYRYIGHNGIVTTPVLLDEIKHYVYYSLAADNNKILTNGIDKKYFVEVSEDELHLWREIDAIGQE